MHHTHYCYQYLQQSSDKHSWCFIHDFTNLLWAAICMMLTIFSSISSPPFLPLPTYLLAFCHPLGSWPQQVFSIIHGTQVQVKLRQLCLHFWTVLLATTKYFRVKCCSLAFALSWVKNKQTWCLQSVEFQKLSLVTWWLWILMTQWATPMVINNANYENKVW